MASVRVELSGVHPGTGSMYAPTWHPLSPRMLSERPKQGIIVRTVNIVPIVVGDPYNSAVLGPWLQ